MGRKIENIEGLVYGRWRVLGMAPYSFTARGARITKWKCFCDPELGGCGTVADVAMNNLRTGVSESCGCTIRKHGMCDSPEFDVWGGMKERCYGRNSIGYKSYGGRGIYICQRWLGSFAAFYEDMGARPTSAHSIDRRDNDGSYTCGRHDLCADCREKNAPANCRWVTIDVQMRNRRDTVLITYDGRTMCRSEWAREIGMDIATLRQRLKKMSVEEAFTRPIEIHDKSKHKYSGNRRMIEYRGVTRSIVGWARELGIRQTCIYMRLNAGMPLDMVFSPLPLPRTGKGKRSWEKPSAGSDEK